MSDQFEPMPLKHREAASKCSAVFRCFLAHNATMHLPAALTFLHVASNQGLSVGEYAKMLGVTGGGMSKLLLLLGDGRTPATQGLGLIYQRRNPQNRRRHEVNLTSKGKALMRALKATLAAEMPTNLC
jgi:DNA-binding MarR family transcriptional regulator